MAQAAFLLVSALRLCGAEGPPTGEQLRGWIAQLGDESFERRQEAEKHLRTAGASSVPALLASAKDAEDAMVRSSCARLALEIQIGDTPAGQLAALASPDPDVAAGAVEKLLDIVEKDQDTAALQAALKADARQGKTVRGLADLLKDVASVKAMSATDVANNPELVGGDSTYEGMYAVFVYDYAQRMGTLTIRREHLRALLQEDRKFWLMDAGGTKAQKSEPEKQK